jgi:hypothetical protein
MTKDLLIREEFKWIYLDGVKSKYIISNFGYVISLNSKKENKFKILKPHLMESGYCIVCLYQNGKEYWRYIHRLVAEAFIEIPEEYLKQGYTMNTLEVNHIDGTYLGKSKNDITNLEWNTSSDNKYHAYNTNLKRQGEDSPVSIYKESQIKEVCRLLEENEIGNREIWNRTGVCVNTISTILSGKQWKSISKDYDFSNHKKRHILYPKEVKEKAVYLIKTTDLSYRDIGDLVGMTRNAVWSLAQQIIS